MAGLRDTDIRLDGKGRLTGAADGDAPLLKDTDCLIQDILLEAATQEGELFYDESWGWSLYDFLHSEDSPMTRLEIQQRIREKLARREEIDTASLHVNVQFENDTFFAEVTFSFVRSGETARLLVNLNQIAIEVTAV